MSETLAPDFSTCMAYATYLVEVFGDKIHAISTNVGSDLGGSSSVSVVLEANEHAPSIVLRIVNSSTAKMMRSVKLGSMTAYVEQKPPGDMRQSVMREALINGASLQEWAGRVKAALYGKGLDEPRFIGPDFDHGLAMAETYADYAEMQSTEAFDEPVYVTADIARDMTDEEAAKLALDISLDEAAAETKADEPKVSLGLTLAVKEDKELTMNVIIEQGDITKCFADEGPTSAIVNAANVTLLGGGGVDGCIHRAAGPMLKAVCETFPTQRGTKEVRCKTGEAKVTEGFKLPADFVIHTVGPIFDTGARHCRYETEKPLDVEIGRDVLLSAITNCLIQAEARGVERVAFPAISCGVFGCPIWLFAQTLHTVLSMTDWDIPEVRVVLFQDAEYDEFRMTWPEGT